MVSMNRLTTEKRAQIIGALVEGNSIRATCRMTGAAKNTIVKLLVDLGETCEAYQDRTFRDLTCRTVQVDEIWAYCYAKQANVPDEHKGTFGYGDIWTWTALDADTKLVPSWLVGERTVEDGWAFLQDLKGRLAGRVQLTSDGWNGYLSAVGLTFGHDVDYAMLIKHYGPDPSEVRRYSPPICTGTSHKVIRGMPNPAKISTSYVERQNNGFSKKVENLAHAVSLHYMHYNFARAHKTLGGRTPAMAAGVADHKWSLVEIAALLDSN
jgi:hypothetical protein